MKFKTFRVLALGGLVAAGAGSVYLVTRPGPPTPTPTPTPIRTPPPPVPAPVPVSSPNPNPNPNPVPTPVPPPLPPGLRDVDQAILSRVRAGLSGDKLADAFPGKPWKVNLYRDAGQPGVNRLKVDLDRDGKWDEKWTFEPDGRVKRQVAPADDEHYTETYLLESSSGWKRKD